MIRAVAILVLVVTTTTSQPPAPAKTVQENHHPTSPESNQQPVGVTPAGADNGRSVLAVLDQEQPSDSKRGRPSVDWWAIANTGLITLFTLLLTILAFRQWLVMKAQGDAMNRQLEAYERPWLKVSIAPDKPAVKSNCFDFGTDGGAGVRFPFVIENIGKSVATNIAYVVRLVAVGRDLIVFSLERRQALRDDKAYTEEFSLFPGDDSGSLLAVHGIGSDEIAIAKFAVGGRQFVSMAVIGRIVYRYATSDRPHHTEFAYLVGRRDAGVKVVMEYPDQGATLYSGDIEWTKAHGDHAD